MDLKQDKRQETPLQGVGVNPTEKKPDGFWDEYWKTHETIYGKRGKTFDPLWDVPNPLLVRLKLLREMFNFSRPAQARFSFFAVASYCLATVGFFSLPVPSVPFAFVFPAFALIFGFVGWRHVNRSGADGRVFAVLGIVFAAAEILLRLLGPASWFNPEDLFTLSELYAIPNPVTLSAGFLLKLVLMTAPFVFLITLGSRRFGKALGYTFATLITVPPIAVIIMTLISKES